MSDPKHLFDAGDGVYLLNHSVGRPLQSTQSAIEQAYLSPWHQGGEDTWPQWLAQIERFRKALGVLLNAAPQNFCPQVNLSSTLGKILQARSLDVKRPVILCCEEDFPSMVFVLEQMRSFGYELRIIRGAGSAMLDPAFWQAQLADDVGVVLLAHVQSNTGYQLPIADITALASARGIMSIVDIAQSVGVIPIDLMAWSADFVIGSSVKWLCGGPGAAYLWGSDQAIASSQPLDVGWFSHEDPFEFDIDCFRYAKDALRFWGGTPSVVPFVIAANSIEQLQAIGINNIRAHNRRLQNVLLQGLHERCFYSPLSAMQSGGTLIINADSLPGNVRDVLQARQVLFDERVHGLRLSPHIYNTSAQMQQVLDCLT